MALSWLFALLLVLPGAWGDCPEPPRFVFAELTTVPEKSYPVGTKLTYRCRPGYAKNGPESPVVTCLPDSTWSRKGNFCVAKSCGQPDIPNGQFHTKTDLLFGATITFTCDIGYRLVGPPSAQCVVRNDEVYWSNVPTCEIILCLPPPEIKNGQLLTGDQEYTFGMAASYSCDEGFSLIGEATIYCTMGNPSGTWSSPAPECKVVKCEDPEVKNGRRLSGFGKDHTYRDSVTFECDNGYRMNGSSVVICEANSTWTPPLPTCDEIRCGPPPRFPFAELTTAVGESSPFGTELRYRCNPGYKAAPGKSSVLTCLSNDSWSAADPDFCVRQQCSPPKIENGKVSGNDTTFPFETVVKFTCNPGYQLKTPSAKCVVSGNGVDWDSAPPYCLRDLSDVVCDEPPTVANGMHNGTQGTRFVYGSVVVYKCNDGFTLAGAASVHCDVDQQYHGVWSKPTPECKGDAPPVGQVPCGKPPTVANGMHNGTEGTGFAQGSVVVYKCNDGFTLAGAASLQCIAGDQYQGVWNKPAPECRDGANMIIVGIFPLLLAMLIMSI